MRTKICSTCQRELDISNFFKGSRYKDGYRGQCKNCTTTKTRSYTQTEKGRQVSRKATREWRRRNPDKVKEGKRKWYYEKGGREYHRKHRLTPQGKLSERKASSKYRKTAKHQQAYLAYVAKNPEKRAAKSAVNNAVKKGILPPISTRVCGCGKQAHHYHHESYSKDRWLDVIPLCRKCHRSKSPQ